MKESKYAKDLSLINMIADQMHSTVDKVVTIQELEKEIDDLFSDTIEFRELFEFIIEYYRDEIERRNLTVNVELPGDLNTYHGNMTIMRTIFAELISNSIMYNKPGGRVDIKAHRRGDFIRIDIVDTGYGIKEEDIENIFQQFYRTENSADMNDKGAGLGLYLVKKFIKYYNGDIKVKSVYGEGSTFSVRLMSN
jgi:two-component system sensor histidine kinase SaeS